MADPSGDRRSREFPDWDALASDWDRDPGPRAYAAAALHSLRDALSGRPLRLAESRVLDFGCGTGLLTERLAGLCGAVDAVDASPAMLAVVREKIARQGWSRVRAMGTPSPAPGSYDLVVASSVCAFLDDYPATVRRLAGLLRPSGVFVQWDWEREPEEPDGHGLTQGEIFAALTAAGLVDIAVTKAFSIEIEGTSVRPLRGVGARPADLRTDAVPRRPPPEGARGAAPGAPPTRPPDRDRWG